MSRTDARGPVLHVTNIPTPYRLPYLRAVRDALEAEGLDFHVFFLGKGKRPREWKITGDDLHGFPHTLNRSSDPITEVILAIERLRPSVVVLAWAMDPPALRLLLYCVLHRIRTVLFTGETEAAAAVRSYPWLRALVRRPFFRLADGFLTYGRRSAEYVRSFGVPAERVTEGLNVVDTEFFRERVDALRADGSAARFRATFEPADGGFTDGGFIACHLLLVGYMIPGKGITTTLRTLAAMGRRDIVLHLVGTGPREAAHRATVAALGLDGRVRFHGYIQQDELPIFYAFADAVLFPSFIDVFGLVMSEAAAAALPVIASTHSGGTADVVVHGETGFALDPRDGPAYAAAIARLADEPGLRRAMGRAARARATNLLTLHESARRYVCAVRCVLPP